MDEIFVHHFRQLSDAIRLFRFIVYSGRAAAAEELAVKKQHNRDPRSVGKDDYDPWPDITPNATRQPRAQAEAAGFDIFINMDNKLSFDDLKNDDNIANQPEKEYSIYQWSQAHAQQKTAKHESTGSTCSDKAFSWENRAMELRDQEKYVFTLDQFHKEKKSAVSMEGKRKVSDYPKWGFEDPKDETIHEKRQRKTNKRDARENKRKTKSKEHVGDPCSQCKRTDQMSMVKDDDVFPYTCHWMPS